MGSTLNTHLFIIMWCQAWSIQESYSTQLSERAAAIYLTSFRSPSAVQTLGSELGLLLSLTHVPPHYKDKDHWQWLCTSRSGAWLQVTNLLTCWCGGPRGRWRLNQAALYSSSCFASTTNLKNNYIQQPCFLLLSLPFFNNSIIVTSAFIVFNKL